MRTSDLVKNALANSDDYDAYMASMKDHVDTGTYSGNTVDEALVNYTALNFSRMKRLNKKLELTLEQKEFIQNYEKSLTLLVLTESWCGDAGQLIPVVHHIASENDLINLRICGRDDQPALMDKFLTNGGRSIPKVLFVQPDTHQVLADWGPRPKELTKMVQAEKQQKGELSADFKETIQRWYNKDKGDAAAAELITILKDLQQS